VKVIYALFKTYPEAREAANALLERGFEAGEMNALVHEEVRDQQELGAGLQRTHEALSAADAATGRTPPLRGLDRLLADQRPVEISGAGTVVAGGNLANLLVRAALDPSGPGPGLAPSLAQFLPADVAERLARGLTGGRLLYWLRTTDDRAAEAAAVLRKAAGASEVHVA
jgi:hypothetical protein